MASNREVNNKKIVTNNFAYKKYSDNEESMYDLNTYKGRLKHFARMTDIR